ncbi:MAG TPA: hypothetical protein DEO64_07470 [Alcaligenes faecalis]|nr:hypothetical protein [Alcaligenes faecalis]
MKWLVLCLIMALLPLNTQARNKPCSGKKGGISHCEGEVFVCRDGSASSSKQSCPDYTRATGNSLEATPQALRSNSPCSCSSGTYCTGSRGGHYCETSTGSKRYQRK